MVPARKSLRFELSAYRPDQHHRPHAHAELQISLVLRGGLCESVAGRVECGGPLSVVVKDPGLVHADDYRHDGALIARLSSPATELRDLVEHPGRAGAWRWTHDPAVATPFLRLIVRGTNGEHSFPTDDGDVLDLLAAHSARAARAPSGAPPAWLRTVIAAIDFAWFPALRSRDLARSAGVHPVYLARCVRRWYGVSLGDLLRRARLRHAARAVAAGATTVSAVAHAHGFSDEAHLCRAFAQATGFAPGRFRRLVQACAALRPGASPSC